MFSLNLILEAEVELKRLVRFAMAKHGHHILHDGFTCGTGVDVIAASALDDDDIREGLPDLQGAQPTDVDRVALEQVRRETLNPLDVG